MKLPSIWLLPGLGLLLPSATLAETPAEPGWMLVWSDEFKGGQIDRAKWGFDIDCCGGGNDERQFYTKSSRNAAIEGGNLDATLSGQLWPLAASREIDILEAIKLGLPCEECPGTPFDKPFYLIFNLAIDGILAESHGVGDVRVDGYSKRMETDWVHVWQRPTSDTPVAAAKHSLKGS